MKIEDYDSVIADLKRRRIPAEVKMAVSLMLDKKAENVVVLKIKKCHRYHRLYGDLHRTLRPSKQCHLP